MKQTLTQTEAAALVGVARSTVQNWESRGWLVAVQEVAPIIGKAGRPAKLYRQADVERVARERGRGRG